MSQSDNPTLQNKTNPAMEKAKVTKQGVRNQGKTRAKGQKFT